MTNGIMASRAGVASIFVLEQAIHHVHGDNVASARATLLGLLRSVVDDQGKDLTISELLQRIPREDRRTFAAIMLRCLAVRGLLPEPTQSNNLARIITELCETELPEIFGFLRIDARDQTFKKFEALTIAHQRICEHLGVMRSQFADIDGALSARKLISGPLNHSAVRAYCAPFGLEQLRIVVNDVYVRLATVAQLSPSLVGDIEDCKSAVSDGHAVAGEIGTFMSTSLLTPFLVNIESILSTFLSASRAKFETRIAPKLKKMLQKRYPFHEPARIIQISIPFSNTGPGLAKDMTVSVVTDSEAIYIENPNITLGNVRPGEFAVVLDVMVSNPLEQCNLIVHVEWFELGGSSPKSDVYEFTALAQASDVDWASYEYWSPYSPDPAQGESFLGRNEKVKVLATKLLRTPMENFYITGQKRVGKTSLALAAIKFAEDAAPLNSKILHRYVLWGHIAHEDPRVSLQMLGVEIDSLLCSSSQDLKPFEATEFLGSLASLSRKAETAAKLAPNCKFVIVIDEFDEIHQELYLKGNLAETFFANLRALSRCTNVCLVLVGGENMPFVMERQGQKLNNFSRFNLSYYDRQTEWNDFRLLVEQPTINVLRWHEDSIAEIFNLCNGNPYFAKIMCAAVLRIAIQGRDTDVSADEVQVSSELEVSALGSNSFAHLWQDGIPKEMHDREPEILVRVRVLVSIARCLRKGKVANLANISSSRGAVQISESDISAVLNDFVRRDVISETNDGYIFKLPVFERWLVDVGSAQLVADSLGQELAQSFLDEERAATVRAEEVVDLVRTWPTYRGKHITTDDVRAWLRQRESARDQRSLFEILKRVRFYNEPRIREHLNSAFSFVLPLLPEFVIRKPSDRRADLIITYVDGEGKSGATYATLFAEENKISTRNIIPPSAFSKRAPGLLDNKETPIGTIVIIDDIAATGNSLSRNLVKFLEDNRDLISRHRVPIRVISVLATEDGQRRILRVISELEGADIDFRVCELIGPTSYGFPDDRSGWSSEELFERAKALSVDLGSGIYKQSPLGHGGLGLVVVLPTTVPNNSLPILHSSSRSGVAARWRPLFPRVTH